MAPRSRRNQLIGVCVFLMIIELALGLPIPYQQVARAEGTSITITHIVPRGKPNCRYGNARVGYDVTTSVPDKTSAQILFSVTAPGAPRPVKDVVSGINSRSGYIIGPANRTTYRYVDENFMVGKIAENTLITILYADTKSNARAGLTVNCTTGEIVLLNFDAAGMIVMASATEAATGAATLAATASATESATEAATPAR